MTVSIVLTAGSVKALDSKKLSVYIDGMVSDGLRKAIDAAGGLRALARLINLRPQSIAQWQDVPVKHILTIEKATGIPRQELRPDLAEMYRE